MADVLATVTFIATEEGVELIAESDMDEDELLDMMAAAVEAARDVPDTPENRAANSWGRHGRRGT